MNICILNEHFGMGGLERVTSVIGKELSKKYSVYFYSMFSDENFFSIKQNFVVGQHKLTNENKWLNPNNYGRKLQKILMKEETPLLWYKKEVSSLIQWVNSKKIDLLVISSLKIISFIPEIQKRTDAKCIAWLHNNYEVYMNQYTKTFKKSFINGLSSADIAVCLTQYDLKKYKKHNCQTVCIYNPLTLENESKSDLRSKNISFTGRLAFDHKGIDYLLEVAKDIPDDWTITMAGNGSEEEVHKLHKLIKENRLGNKVLFIGPQNGKNLIQHYKKSSIYLMTSRWEGFGLVLVEAMSFGLPIIAFSQSGSNEVLDYGKYGILVENGNVDVMKSELRKLIDNIETRRIFSEKSLQRVEDFSLNNIMIQWINLIESLKIGETNE